MKTKRPILRYYGGKWKLAPWLLSVFPKHRIYVEPFGGGASVLLQKQPCYAEVYNDLNREIVNVFRLLRDPKTAAELCRLIALTPFSREDFKESYEQTDNPVEAARRTIIRSFMGFGSSALETPRGMRTRASIWGHTGFRKDTARSGTTPAHDWQNYPLHITKFCERLSGVVIENKPASEVIQDHDRKDTLFYCDPPYLMSTRSSPRHEYRFEMTESEHVELARVLHSVKGMVVISGYPSKLYDCDLYEDWYRIERPHFADGGRKKTEVAWMNPASERARPQQSLISRSETDALAASYAREMNGQV